MLYLYRYDDAWRARWAPRDFLVVFSDTGDEHPETYAHIERTRAWCAKENIAFETITKDRGYHAPSWRDLITHYREYETVQVHGFSGACTQQLKIAPIYKFLDDWIGQTYGYPSGQKRAIHAFGREHGKIRVLLGMAAKETKRVPYEKRKPEHQTLALTRGRAKKPLTPQERAARNNPSLWGYWIDQCFPLYEEDIDRAGAQAIIKRYGCEVPPPSNCMRCHYQSPIELVWLWRFHPDKFHEWEQLEEAKIQRDAAGRPDREGGLRVIPLAEFHGVYGHKRLRERLNEALAQHGHMTDAELHEYKMSHGHCTMTNWGG